MSTTTFTAWIIECARLGPSSFLWIDNGAWRWTSNAWQAIKFVDEASAKQLAGAAAEAEGWTIRQHEFIVEGDY